MDRPRPQPARGVHQRKRQRLTRDKKRLNKLFFDISIFLVHMRKLLWMCNDRGLRSHLSTTNQMSVVTSHMWHFSLHMSSSEIVQEKRASTRMNDRKIPNQPTCPAPVTGDKGYLLLYLSNTSFSHKLARVSIKPGERESLYHSVTRKCDQLVYAVNSCRTGPSAI